MADNNISVSGNITRAPELKFTKNGQPLTRFSVAVNRRWQNKQSEWEEATSFFDVSCWGPLAENAANSLTQGNRVLVTGRLEQRSWEAEDGSKRSTVEIVAEDIAPSLRFATASISKVTMGTKSTNPDDEPF